MRLDLQSPAVERINGAMAEWRQGDAALEERWFTHVAEPAYALTPESAQAADGLQAITSEVEGLVVVTQTCDVVRCSVDRPFIEVAPLVRVPRETLLEVEKARRPARAYVRIFAEHGLVVDLDRVMTVEKSIVADWKRTLGCRTDNVVRAFATALSRKRKRFAFPNDFNKLTSKLGGHLSGKHNKNSDAGRALRALREIRVRAAPEWDGDEVELTFWFIRGADEPHFEGQGWGIHFDTWMGLLSEGGRFTNINGSIQTLDDLTANDYVESNQLDLDHLSS